MIFASPVFLFLFLPTFLIIYYLTPPRIRSLTILVGSSVFYGWWRADFLALLYGVIIWNWLIALAIEKWREPPCSKPLLFAGLAGNCCRLRLPGDKDKQEHQRQTAGCIASHNPSVRRQTTPAVPLQPLRQPAADKRPTGGGK